VSEAGTIDSQVLTDAYLNIETCSLGARLTRTMSRPNSTPTVREAFGSGRS
jgi:hypothetical protein